MNYRTVIKKSIIGWALLLILSASYPANPPVYLRFHDSTTVYDPEITLGDIAIIECPSGKELVLQLARTKVGNAAPAGFSRYLSTYEVLQYVLAPHLNNLEVNNNGVKRIKIHTKARVRSVNDYRDQILEYMANNIKWEREDHSISIKNSDRQWRCYDRPFTVSVEGLSTPYPKGNVRLKLRILQDSIKKIVPVICRVKVETEVVCASKTIGRNQIMNNNVIELRKMDITAYRYTPISDVSSLINKIAVKTISPGTIIHKQCIKSAPSVSKGDIVYITLEKGNVRISVPARAREDGCVGEKIWVENTKSHRLIQVEVGGKGIVYFNKGEAI